MELIAMAGLAGQKGNIEKVEAGMVQNLLRLKVLSVRDIMTPMTVIYSLAENLSVAATFKNHLPIKFSRIPLLNQDGRAKQYLRYIDLLEAHQADGADDRTLHELAYPLTSVVDSMKVFSALEIMTESLDKMILVTNEFGHEIGLVTVEDILEAITGKAIADEDDEHASMRDHALQQSKTEQR
ncbi:MAG: CBS domain-containing protein [Planctomycetaceae bacterium]